MARAVLRADDGLTVEGPFRADAVGPELTAFRARAYEGRLAHLLSATVQDLDGSRGMDARSEHFVARTEAGIVGAFRATARPFEIEHLSEALSAEAGRFDGYVEVSRFVVAPERAVGVSTKLIAAALVWAYDAGTAGVIALCRPSAARLLRRFGLAEDPRSFAVPTRPDRPYRLISGSWAEIAARCAIPQQETPGQEGGR